VWIEIKETRKNGEEGWPGLRTQKIDLDNKIEADQKRLVAAYNMRVAKAEYEARIRQWHIACKEAKRNGEPLPQRPIL